MKKLIPYYAAVLIVLCSCKKSDTAGADNGCISQINFQPSQVLLSAADQATAVKLFQQNSIAINTLQFYRYIYDNGAYALPGPYEYVRANQYFNNLLLFNGDILFNFRQGVLYNTRGTKFNGINLNAKAKLTLMEVRNLFLNAAIAENATYSTLKDSCLTAQFGYYDLNAGTNLVPGNFVKAWKVNIKNYTYPLAYLEDDNSKTIYFDNGVRTFVTVKHNPNLQ